MHMIPTDDAPRKRRKPTQNGSAFRCTSQSRVRGRHRRGDPVQEGVAGLHVGARERLRNRHPRGFAILCGGDARQRQLLLRIGWQATQSRKRERFENRLVRLLRRNQLIDQLLELTRRGWRGYRHVERLDRRSSWRSGHAGGNWHWCAGHERARCARERLHPLEEVEMVVWRENLDVEREHLL